MPIITCIIALLIIIIILIIGFNKRNRLTQPDAETERQILRQHVLFYQRLTNEEKGNFEERLRKFLRKVRITGIKTIVEDADRVFIAAAAIIPIFRFEDWEYRNINEILLYPGSFDEDFQVEGEGRDFSGLVGNGPMQNVMILSQQDLRNGFLNNFDKHNTAIHEFVHLVDTADGDTDGIPRAILAHKYTLPWLQRIHQEIQKIELGESDINPYAATNEAEFLQLLQSIFEQPQLMSENHPALYELLNKIFSHDESK